MKNTVLILATLFLSVIVYAQEEFVPETYFGIKLGGNSTGIFSDPLIIQNIYPGLTSGLVFKHISQKSLGIQMELNYNQAGWSENLYSTNTYIRRLDYIQLPIMSHVSLGNKKMRYVINLGPYVSYLLSEKEEIDLMTEAREKDYYRKAIDNKAEVGFCFGVGVSRHTSIGLFQAEARVSSGLTDIFKKTQEVPYATSKNISAGLSISYMIDFTMLKRSDKKKVIEMK